MIKLNGIKVGDKFFPNGELNLLDINEATATNLNHHSLEVKYYSDKDLMALYFIKKYLDSVNDGKEIHLEVAYMPYSRMDRAETPETPFMLSYVAEFINGLNFSKVNVYEPHSQITVDLLDNVTPYYHNDYLFEAVKETEEFLEIVDYLVFPDAGAMKRYEGTSIKAQNTLYGNKTRDFATGRITGLELVGDMSNINSLATAVIVDDLSSFGGTFVKTSEKLRELGFKRIVLLVFHAENSIFKGELFNHIDHVYTTDSILTEHGNWEYKKFQDKLTVFSF